MEDVSIIFFLMALAIAVTILHTFLKQAGRDEYAYLAVIAGLALALVRVLPLLRNLFDGVQEVFNLYG
ncbi:MAG: SpoIIIAC/SpoIIIAD family protein [Bacillota bacterium]|nr:SpoIIIAC/SpoIIIAD family protein [Bacillota bacterium]